MKKYLLILLIALSFNVFGQEKEFMTFSDNYADYFLTQTTSEWSKKNVPTIMISQTENDNCYDNYWHSTVTLINSTEIIEYLKETRNLYIERDSIESSKKSYSYDLNEINCLKGHKAALSDNITANRTYGVKISSTYIFTYVSDSIKRSIIMINFVNTSNNRWVSDVKLSMTIDQLNDLINKLEKFQ